MTPPRKQPRPPDQAPFGFACVSGALLGSGSAQADWNDGDGFFGGFVVWIVWMHSKRRGAVWRDPFDVRHPMLRQVGWDSPAGRTAVHHHRTHGGVDSVKADSSLQWLEDERRTQTGLKRFPSGFEEVDLESCG